MNVYLVRKISMDIIILKNINICVLIVLRGIDVME